MTGETIRFQNFEVSWAGPHPFRDGFCFGSDSGKLLFTDELGIQLGDPGKASASEEAINGVAELNGWLAVSTRADVNFLNPFKGGGELFPGGAHGVIAAAGGYFVAPLGRLGLMIVKVGQSPETPIALGGANKEGLYFYRVVALQNADGQDLLACACRRGGLGVTRFSPDMEKCTLSTLTFPGLDVVDICLVGSAKNPRAVVALGRDGTLIMIRDILVDINRPQTLSFQNVKGTAYRLLNCQGHLFLLTSTGLYGLMHLAERFLEGARAGGFQTPILVVPSEAVDANIVRDRWLLIVMADQVHKVDVQKIEQAIPEQLKDGGVLEFEAREMQFAWEYDTMELATP